MSFRVDWISIAAIVGATTGIVALGLSVLQLNLEYGRRNDLKATVVGVAAERSTSAAATNVRVTIDVVLINSGTMSEVIAAAALLFARCTDFADSVTVFPEIPLSPLAIAPGQKLVRTLQGDVDVRQLRTAAACDPEQRPTEGSIWVGVQFAALQSDGNLVAVSGRAGLILPRVLVQPSDSAPLLVLRPSLVRPLSVAPAKGGFAMGDYWFESAQQLHRLERNHRLGASGAEL